MALRISHNIAAINAWRNLGVTDFKMARSMEHLSSGYRINRGADDPAGLAISQKMRAQLSGLNQAISNSENAVSMVQTAEGALNELHNLLTDMRRLAVHAANSAINDQTMRDADQAQVKEAINTIDRIATQSKFGSKRLLNGIFTLQGGSDVLGVANEIWEVSLDLALTDATRYSSSTATDPVTGETQERATFHVGADANQTVFISVSSMTANRLGTIDGAGAAHVALNTVDVSTTAAANTAIGTISLAIGGVSNLRSALGAFQTYTLESNAANLRVASENLTAAESNIRDTDMAMEMVQFTKNQIMLQAGTAMLAQANLIPQTVLQLLQ